jgi:hypothetical protein
LIAFVLLFGFSSAFGLNHFYNTSLAGTANPLNNVDALINSGQYISNLGTYTQAIKYFDKALSSSI